MMVQAHSGATDRWNAMAVAILAVIVAATVALSLTMRIIAG